MGEKWGDVWQELVCSISFLGFGLGDSDRVWKLFIGSIFAGLFHTACFQ